MNNCSYIHYIVNDINSIYRNDSRIGIMKKGGFVLCSLFRALQKTHMVHAIPPVPSRVIVMCIFYLLISML